MQLKDVGVSLRRHWLIALVILLTTPIVAGVYLFNNRGTAAPPARYTTSADMLIPAKDKNGMRPPGVPPTLLQGQVDLALSGENSRGRARRGPISTRISPGESRSTPSSTRRATSSR